MKRVYINLVLALMLVCTFPGIAKAQQNAVRCPVYMFAFSASFADSAAYITEVQHMDSTVVLLHDFLADRSLYGLQFTNYLEKTLGRKNMTTAVFYEFKRNKAEKLYLKIRKRYLESGNVTLIPVGTDKFKFYNEEYTSPTAEDEARIAEQARIAREARQAANRPQKDGPIPDAPVPGKGGGR